jgi:uncharacterized membrane protein
MKVEKSIKIHAGISRTWDVLTDFKNYPVWMRSNEKIESLSSKEIGKGITFYLHGIVKGTRYKTYNRVVEWKEDEELGVYVTSLLGEAYTKYRLSKIPGGCEVIYTVDFTLTKKLQSKHDLYIKHHESVVDETLQRLKEYLEISENKLKL